MNCLSTVIEQLSSEQRDLDTSLFAVFQDILEPLRSASSIKPILLVFDDLQWSDAASIELLEIAALEIETAPLVVIATMRSNEVEQNQRLVDALTALSREPIYTDIRLGGLSEDEVGRVAGAGLRKSFCDARDRPVAHNVRWQIHSSYGRSARGRTVK